VVFFADDEQKETAIAYKNQLDKSGVFHAPIATSFEPLSIFYEAENYHHNYYNLHSNEPYCRLMIRPKLEKYLKSLSK
jgi:peptide methionine sulfoxide reductase MsrA